MSDELRAAAERLNQIRFGATAAQVYESDGRTQTFEALLDTDLRTVVLREHPADSDTPVDEKWLRSVGFSNLDARYGPCCLQLSGLNAWKGNDSGDWQWRFELGCLNRHRGFETRGDVRLLCRALGIKLSLEKMKAL